MAKIRLCAVQHPRVRSASGRAAPGTWHSSRSTSSVSIKASISLSQNNFAKFLASALTRMILRSFRSSLHSMGLVYFWANGSWYFYWNSRCFGIYMLRYQIKYILPHFSVYWYLDETVVLETSTSTLIILFLNLVLELMNISKMFLLLYSIIGLL